MPRRKSIIIIIILIGERGVRGPLQNAAFVLVVVVVAAVAVTASAIDNLNLLSLKVGAALQARVRCVCAPRRGAQSLMFATALPPSLRCF